MSGAPSLLSQWMDRDFWDQGAFLTTSDGQILFAKGGAFCVVNQFIESNHPVFYLKDFYQNQYLAYIPSEFIQVSSAIAIHWSKGLSTHHHHISPIANDDDLYQKDFRILQNSFDEKLEKVVLISRESYEAFEGEHSIQRLLQKSLELGAGLPYGLWNKSYGMIGSTPETLYQIKNGSIKTFALAGTAKQGEDEKLLNSNKDLHEHELVIKDISEKLSPFVTDLKIGKTDTFAFNSIIHLKTDIEGTLQAEVHLTELTNVLSPTAALGGYPTKKALAFLKGTNYFQKNPMRYFGSAFGLIHGDLKEFVVSIRNVQWEGQHLYIESGGGVVAESVFEKELDEIHLKRNTIRKHYL